MQNDTPITLSKEQHKNMLFMVTNVYMFLGGKELNLRAGLEYRDRVYYRETDWTTEQLRARWSNFLGDAKKMQNVTVPVVQPQVEATVGYLAEVFCTGEPFYGVVTPPAQVDIGIQMEAVISDNSRRFAWRAEYIKCFRDGLKYNLMAMEKSWETKKTFSVINDPRQKDGVSADELYSGNFAKRLDLYNMILDTRVAPNQIHMKGEFAGYVELYPRMQLKQLIIDLGPGNTMNVTDAFKSGCGAYTVGSNTPGEFYIPLVNPLALLTPQSAFNTNWTSWLNGISKNGNLEYRDLYEVAVLYARFLPSDFGLPLPAKNTPQIFKLIIVNRQWIIYCKRMSNAHNFLPIVVGQPFDDGLGYQAKSYGDNVTPYQEMASSLWSSGIESKRRLVFDRLFYDPSRISKADIDKSASVARIPVKAAGYGKPVSDAVYAAPYRDDSVVGLLQMAQQVQIMAQTSNGTNAVQQGQFQKGNKTKVEFETVMNKSDWSPRLMAINLEDSWFAPLKEIVKMNILQYQGPTDLFTPGGQSTTKVNPTQLRTLIMQFKMTDGQTPSEKLMSSDLMQNIAQLAMALPEVNAEYDVAGMLMYSYKAKGAYWLDQFKRNPQQQQQYLALSQQTTNSQTPPDGHAAAANQHAQAKLTNRTPAPMQTPPGAA